MEYREVCESDRTTIVEHAAELIREKQPDFDIDNFDRIHVYKKPTSIRIFFDMSLHFVPHGCEEDHLSYSAEVIFSENTTIVHVFDNLFIPTAESAKAVACFSDLDLSDEGILTVCDFPDCYDATLSRGIDGGSEGYRFTKKTGVREMIWHEHADPGLQTSIIGLSDDDLQELQ